MNTPKIYTASGRVTSVTRTKRDFQPYSPHYPDCYTYLIRRVSVDELSIPHAFSKLKSHHLRLAKRISPMGIVQYALHGHLVVMIGAAKVRYDTERGWFRAADSLGQHCGQDRITWFDSAELALSQTPLTIQYVETTTPLLYGKGITARAREVACGIAEQLIASGVCINQTIRVPTTTWNNKTRHVRFALSEFA